MRAKASIEEVGKDRENIVITEIPYQVNKARLVERIAELVQTKKIEGISDVRDESDREGMRVVVEIKRGEESQLILNHLYKLTQMQESFGMILLAIAGGQPREMGLIELLRLFLEHRREVVLRRTRFDLRKAEEREHILLGYQIALDHLDNVIKIIRVSSRANARENLHDFFENKDRHDPERHRPKRNPQRRQAGPQKVRPARRRFRRHQPGAGSGLSYIQIDAILELQLHRLTRLSVDEILKELAEIRAKIAELKEILASEKKLKQVIVAELREVQKDYGRRAPHADRGRRRGDQGRGPDRRRGHGHHHQPRRLHQAHAGGRLPPPVARRQGAHRRENARRGFRRVPVRRLGAQLHFAVQLQGPRVLAEGVRNSGGGRGHARQGHRQPGEVPGGRAPHRPGPRAQSGRGRPFVFFATRNGTVKKTALAEFSNPRPSGIIAINLDEEDELIGVKLTDGKQMIFLASHDGQAILFRETEVRAMGRKAGGVNGMDLAKDDYVVSMDAVQPDFEILKKESKKTRTNLDELENEAIKDSLTSLMLTVSEKGYGKRTPLAEYRITSRGGKGVINLKSTDRNGPVVAALQVSEESDVMIITEFGKIIRVHANEIREAGRSTQGVRLLRLEDEDKIAAAASIHEDPEVAEEKK